MMNHPEVERMKKYKQHRNANTYAHCRHVTLKSIRFIQRTGIRADMEAVVRGAMCKKLKLDYVSAARGAMLHDFYLYEATNADITPWRHGWTHPETALGNAEKIFSLSPKEKNIIYSHMWPIRITHIPKCREAVIVNVADKVCAVQEMLFWRRKAVKRGA